MLDREHLRVLGDGREPFCPLIAVETGHEKWATWRQLSRLLKMVRAAFSASPTQVMALVVVVMTGGPSVSSNLKRDALVRWVDGASSGGYGS
jgi:hypothetical protein